MMMKLCKNALRVFREIKERACVHCFCLAKPLGSYHPWFSSAILLWSVLEIKYDNQIREWNEEGREPSSDTYYGGVIASQGYPNFYYGDNYFRLWIYALQGADVYVTFTLHSPSSLLVDRKVVLRPDSFLTDWLDVFSVNESTPVSVLVGPRQRVRINDRKNKTSGMHPAFLLRFNGKCLSHESLRFQLFKW